MGKLFSLTIVVLAFISFSFFNQKEEVKTATDSGPKAVKTSIKADPDSLGNAQFFPVIKPEKYDNIFRNNTGYFSDGFDFPVGKPNGDNYFKALDFGQRMHLGEDWNGMGGGNTDLGDPVYTAASGLVVYADEVCCGWGNTVRIIHFLPYHSEYKYVETVYSHLHNVYVEPGDLISRGEKIGSIGNAKGRYSAHLHFEMRDFVNMSMGPGYSEDKFGYLHPTDFINLNRPE